MKFHYRCCGKQQHKICWRASAPGLTTCSEATNGKDQKEDIFLFPPFTMDLEQHATQPASRQHLSREVYIRSGWLFSKKRTDTKGALGCRDSSGRFSRWSWSVDKSTSSPNVCVMNIFSSCDLFWGSKLPLNTWKGVPAKCAIDYVHEVIHHVSTAALKLSEKVSQYFCRSQFLKNMYYVFCRFLNQLHS